MSENVWMCTCMVVGGEGDFCPLLGDLKYEYTLSENAVSQSFHFMVHLSDIVDFYLDQGWGIVALKIVLTCLRNFLKNELTS